MAAIPPAIGGAVVKGMELLWGATKKAAGAVEMASDAFKAASGYVHAFNKVTNDAVGILAKFSQVGLMGANAQLMLQIGDLKRSMEISRQLNTEMAAFSVSTNKARDAWMKFDIVLNKSVLIIGTSFNNLVEKLVPIIEPVVNWLGKAADAVSTFVTALSMSTKAFQPVIDLFSNALSATSKVIEDLAPKFFLLGGTLLKAFNDIAVALGPVIDEFTKASGSAFGGLLDVLVVVVDALGKVLVNIVVPAFVVLGNVLNRTIDILANFMMGLAKWADWFTGNQLGFAKSAEAMKQWIDVMREAAIQKKKDDAAEAMANIMRIMKIKTKFQQGAITAEEAFQQGGLNPWEFALSRRGFGGKGGQENLEAAGRGFRKRQIAGVRRGRQQAAPGGPDPRAPGGPRPAPPRGPADRAADQAARAKQQKQSEVERKRRILKSSMDDMQKAMDQRTDRLKTEKDPVKIEKLEREKNDLNSRKELMKIEADKIRDVVLRFDDAKKGMNDRLDSMEFRMDQVRSLPT